MTRPLGVSKSLPFRRAMTMMPRPAAPDAGFTTNSLRSPMNFHEPPHVAVAADDRVRLRHRNAVRVTDVLRDGLVVDARIERARIAFLDERQVAVIDAQDAALAQLVRPDKQPACVVDSSDGLARFDQVAEPPQLGEPIAGISAQAK